MTDERWQEIIGRIKDNFKIINQEIKDLDQDTDPGSVEIVEFIGPLGKMKLERTTRPLIIDKKTIGSRRIGSESTVKYIYSTTEKVHKFTAYRFDEGISGWVEMELPKGSMSF